MSPEMRAEDSAAILWEHWSASTTLAGLPDPVAPRTRAQGYASQAALVALAGGVAGWKIAATSAAGQAHIGVDGPLPGRIFDRFVVRAGATVPGTALHMAVAEAEFAFRIDDAISAETAVTLSREDVLARVGVMHLAIELPESRFADFASVGEAQLLADDACAGRFVLGAAVPAWRELDLPRARTRLTAGAESGDGVGANVLGDPVSALHWLVNELGAHGIGIEPGAIVTTGTTTVPVPIARGDRVRAEFDGLGAVEVWIDGG